VPELRPSPDESAKPGKGPWRRFALPLVKYAAIAAILYYLGLQVSYNWGQISDYNWTISLLPLGLSLAIGLAAFFIMAIVWRAIIGAFGFQLSMPAAFRIFYLSNLGRYIPGKVWQLFGILYLTGKKGIPAEAAGASFVLVQLFAIPASFLVFAVAAWIEPKLLIDRVAILGETTSYVITGGMILLCSAVVLFPGAFLAVGNRLLRLVKRPEVRFNLDKKVALGVFLGYGIGWICYGTAFWLFVRSVAPETELSVVAGVGLFNAAYQIGYLVLFAPGGFGPREVVMGALLAPFVGPIGAAIAIAARLWALVLESAAALLALAVRK